MALPAGPARGAAGEAVDTNGLLNLDSLVCHSSTHVRILDQYFMVVQF